MTSNSPAPDPRTGFATCIDDAFAEHAAVVEDSRQLLPGRILEGADLITSALAAGRTVFWCGNGGSAADSQHLAAELVGRFKRDRRPLPSVALTTDSSVLTCIANDFGYEDVFARQIEALGRPGDVLIGISTSGQSENVVRAIRKATAQGLTTIALLGKSGGVCAGLATLDIIVPSETTARIQEMHIMIGQLFCELAEHGLGLA